MHFYICAIMDTWVVKITKQIFEWAKVNMLSKKYGQRKNHIPADIGHSTNVIRKIFSNIRLQQAFDIVYKSRKKAILLTISETIKDHVGTRCYNLAGNGELQGGVKTVEQYLPEYKYVIKSDVASYYETTNHSNLMQEIKKIIKVKKVISLIQQYLKRCDILDGETPFSKPRYTQGQLIISTYGCLSLEIPVDAVVEKDCAYVRYMDDWAILTKTRCSLRCMVKKMHGVIQALKFKLAKDKTFIGKIGRGFDFLGYRFSNEGIIGLAARTIQNFLQRIAKLYEQNAGDLRISQYVRNWTAWVQCY